MASDVPTEEPAVRTFLIADVREYTRYTQEHGDEAAARLAARFAETMRATVQQGRGRLVELRGDEGLAVFASARQAVRTAVNLQETFSAISQTEADTPLQVGVGLDAGEAVPVEGGYRGGALNLAARLCSLAGPGEILATDAVVHLARRLDGIDYVELRPQRLKGFTEPVRVMQIVLADGSQPNTPPPVQPGTIAGVLGNAPETPMVARSREIDVVRRVLDAAAGGQGSFLLIRGEPGIGKTRLLQELATDAGARGFLVCAAACFEQRQIVPFFPIVDILEGLALVAPPGVVRESRERHPILGRLVPEFGSADAKGDAGGAEEQARLMRAIASFIESASTAAPVALCIDDVQWADLATVDLLAYLARTMRASPLVIAATYRDREIDRRDPLEQVVADLDARGLVTQLHVRGLGAAETAALVKVTVPDAPPAVVDAIQRETGGNPFFVRELARAVREGTGSAAEGGTIPERVRTFILGRVGRLPLDVQQALGQVSVLGQQFSFDDARRLLGASEEDTEVWLEQATRAGLLVHRSDEAYAFQHGLTQATLYAELSPRRRKRLHRAAGEALEQSLKGQASGTADLAWHFLNADDAERGIRYAIQAGDQAQHVFAYAEAARLYSAALEVGWSDTSSETATDRALQVDLLRKLADVLKIMGRTDEALETLERALQVVAETGDHEAERLMLSDLALVSIRAYRAQDAVPRLEAMLVPTPAPTPGWAALLSALAALYLQTRSAEEALSMANRAVALATQVADVQLLAGAQVTRGEALALLDRFTEAREAIEGAVPLLQEHQADSLVDAFIDIGNLLYVAGQLSESVRALEQALQSAKALQDRALITAATFQLGFGLFRAGRWMEARDRLERAEEHGSEREPGREYAYISACLHRLDIHQGRWDHIETNLAQDVNVALSAGDADLTAMVRTARAEYELLTGHPQHALAEMHKALEEIGGNERWVLELTASRCALEAGDMGAAERYMVQAVEIATRRRLRPLLAQCLWVRGRIRVATGQPQEGRRLLEAALSLAQSMSDRFLEAQVLRALAELLEGEEARAALSSSLDLYRALDARPYIEQVMVLLK